MTRRPNIILVQTDQQKARTMRLYGGPCLSLPNLERLAETGVTLPHAFTNSPLCIPSRTSMFTGRYPHATGTTVNFVHLNPHETALTHVLRRAGYRSALVGKNHCFCDGKTLPPSLNYFEGERLAADLAGERTDELRAQFDLVYEARHNGVAVDAEPDPEIQAAAKWGMQPRIWHTNLGIGTNPYDAEICTAFLLSKKAIEFIESYHDQPFFLWLSYPEPHTPFQAPEPYASMYRPEDVDVPPFDSLEGKPENQRVARTMMGMEKVSEEDLRKTIALWYGMQNYIDDSLGRVIETLDRLRLREDTVIIYTSDHVEFMGEHSMVHKINCFYDCIIRVPLVISWPGHIAPDIRCPHLVELVDIMPTVLDLLGLDVPYGVQGRSLAPFLRGDTYEAREFVVSECGEASPLLQEKDLTWRPRDPFDDRFFPGDAFAEMWFGRCKMVRTHDWKLTVYDWGEGELYDLAADPWELNNLYTDPAQQERIKELKLMLLEWCLEMEDKKPRNVTSEYPINMFEDTR